MHQDAASNEALATAPRPHGIAHPLRICLFTDSKGALWLIRLLLQKFPKNIKHNSLRPRLGHHLLLPRAQQPFAQRRVLLPRLQVHFRARVRLAQALHDILACRALGTCAFLARSRHGVRRVVLAEMEQTLDRGRQGACTRKLLPQNMLRNVWKHVAQAVNRDICRSAVTGRRSGNPPQEHKGYKGNCCKAKDLVHHQPRNARLAKQQQSIPIGPEQVCGVLIGSLQCAQCSSNNK